MNFLFACIVGLPEKHIHGNGKFRQTPLTRTTQLYAKLIAMGACMRRQVSGKAMRVMGWR